MKKTNKKITVIISGTKTRGYKIEVSNKGDDWNSDIYLTAEELEVLAAKLKAYFKK